MEEIACKKKESKNEGKRGEKKTYFTRMEVCPRCEGRVKIRIRG